MSAADDLAVLARVTASLVVVVALAVLAARFARKVGTRGGGAGLRVLHRTGLSREASVAVVEIGGRGLVVGVTAQGVTLLTELTADELAAATDVAEASVPAPRRIVVRSEAVGAQPRSPAPQVAHQHGTGAVLDPRTWRQGVEALRDLTARRR